MAQDVNYEQALADIKAGLQNVIPRISTSGDKIVMVQGSDTFTFPISQPVTSTNILK